MIGTDVPTDAPRLDEYLIVCCHCRRVRDAEGEWEERLVREGEPVSHGICRACFREFYPTIPLPDGLP